MINQRELGQDTMSWANALRSSLREDPDVILVGEMRDLDTMAGTLTAAETGHLVFSTLHTCDASQTVDRIVDVFPPHQQQQIRIQLASVLEGVFSQQLIPHASGKGRVPAVEVMITTSAVRNLIREGKSHQIYNAIQTGNTVTFDQVIAVSDGSLKVGADVANASVTATVMEQGRGKKVIVYKYKRKTGYHKKNGHRQSYTQVKIEKINA